MGQTVQANEISLGTMVADLPGMRELWAKLFARMGVLRVKELVEHYPLRYEQEWAEGGIADLPREGIGTTRGTVTATRVIPRRGRGKGSFQATLQGPAIKGKGAHSLALVWFNGTYLKEKIHPGMVVRVQGKVREYGGYPQMVNPKWEVISEEAGNEHATVEGRLRPVYPATEGLAPGVIEQVIAGVLPGVLARLSDPLGAAFVEKRGMPSLAEAIRMAHQPASMEEVGAARRRLAFNELLLFQLGVAMKRRWNQTKLESPALRWSGSIDEHIRARFPFRLTAGQEKVIGEIVRDMRGGVPMNRLLQGDVGSGKTIVAAYALLLAVANRKQGAMMAPTELLAEQHYQLLSEMLRGSNVRVALLTGDRAGGEGERAALLEQMESGGVDIVVGTQALLGKAVRFKELAVVVIDEQHRFGVLQRAAFRSIANQWSENSPESRVQSPELGRSRRVVGGQGSENSPESRVQSPELGRSRRVVGGQGSVVSEQKRTAVGSVSGSGAGSGRRASPHYLVMTATPIPRTLTLTVFGDLDISTIAGLPAGRKPVLTRVVEPGKADEVYRYTAERVARGERAYVVVPVVDGEGEEEGDESAEQLKNVMDHAELLQKKYFRDVKVAAVHGRLKRAVREAVMRRFREGKVAVLVATTVIEVGVDVPEATVMVVEHAERFGLAQLHQLRGRIGRGDKGHRGLCVLIADPATEDARRRVEAIAQSNDGFKIAELDWEIRGLGDLFGTKQHGVSLFRTAKIPEDLALLRLAGEDAKKMVDADPMLESAENQRLRKILFYRYGERMSLIDVG